MNRSRRLVLALIRVLPVLILFVISILYVVGQFREVLDNSNLLLMEELSHRLNREVKIGRVRITPLGTAVLEDVRIATGESFKYGTLFKAKEVRLRYNWRALLLKGMGAQSVSRVDLSDPWLLLIRRPDGTFNIQDLLKPPPGPRRPPFAGKVQVVNGTVVFRDYRSQLAKQSAVTSLFSVDGNFEAALQPKYSFNISGKSTKDRLKTADLVGVYNSSNKTIRLDISAVDASAAYWTHYFGLLKSFDIKSGKLRVLAGVTIKMANGKTRASITGVGKVTGGVISIPRIKEPVKDISGRVLLAGDKAALNLFGTVANSRVRVNGNISNFAKPILALTLSSPNLDFGRLLQVVNLPAAINQIKASGRGPVIANISGSPANPLVMVQARIPRISSRGYTASNLIASAAYRSDLIEFQSAQFNALGARFAASGVIDTKGTPTISATGHVTGLNIASVPLPGNFKATGSIRAAFSVSGTPANPAARINAVIPGGSLNGVHFASARGQIEYNNGQVYVPNLVISNIEGGSVRISGSASQRALNLAVSTQGVNIGRLASAFGRPGIEGVGFFQGRITGTPSSPAFAGVLEVFKGKFGQYAADYARVQFAGERQTVEITSAVVRMFPAEIAFTGKLTMLPTGNIAFNGQANVERLTLGKLQEAMGTNLDMSGVVVGGLQASGVFVPRAKTMAAALRNTVATGSLRIEDGTAFGYPISTASAQVAFRNDKLTIENASVVTEEANIILGGTVAVDSRTVDLDFSLKGFELARLHRMFDSYAVVAGNANANGSITGPWGKVQAKADVNIDGLTVNGKRYDVASLGILYSDSIIENLQADLKRNGQQFAVQLIGYNLKTNCMELATANLKNVSVPDLWDIITSSPQIATESAQPLRETLASVPRLTSGTLNGKLQMNGCLAFPDGSLNLTASNVGIDVQEIESITLEASAVKGVVNMHSTVNSGETVVDITGNPLFKDGQVQLSVDARNLDLSRLRPWLGANTPGGTATVVFEVSGNIDSPVVMGSIEVVDPSFHGVKFDSLRVSRIEVNNGRIDISDVILAINGHQAVAQGSVPWDWSTFSVPEDKPLQLTASLRQEDLSMLGTFSSAVDVARTRGAVTAQVQLTGTLANPMLSGNLIVADGNLAIKGFSNDFTNLNIDMEFDGRRIVVQQMSMASSLGGVMQVTPGSYITIGDLDTSEANIKLHAQKFIIAEKNLLGFQEDVNMQLDAGIGVTGTLAHPVVANAAVDGTQGGILVSNAKISFITPKTMPTSTGPTLPINPAFNVSINLGSNVWVAPPSVSIRVAGGGTLKGTLEKPDLDLSLDVQEGSIRVAGRRLRVVPGGTILARYAPPEQPVLRFDMNAVTSVVATNPLGLPEQYKITIHVTGPVTDLQIGLSSEPAGLTKEQMLAALGHLEGVFTSGEVGLQRELGNILGAVGASTLFAPIENLFVEKFGFEEFNVEFGPEIPFGIYISRRLFNNFYVSYYQQVEPAQPSVRNMGYAVNLSWRFKKFYFLSAGVDEQDIFTFQAGFSRSFR